MIQNKFLTISKMPKSKLTKEQKANVLQIYYKISNTPLVVARRYGYIRTPVWKYIYIKKLDILVHEDQKKLISELMKVDKAYEIMTKKEREWIAVIIASNITANDLTE